jgi:hypothetical protein
MIWRDVGESGKCGHAINLFTKGVIDMTTPDSTKTYHDQAQKFFEQTAKKSD